MDYIDGEDAVRIHLSAMSMQSTDFAACTLARAPCGHAGLPRCARARSHTLGRFKTRRSTRRLDSSSCRRVHLFLYERCLLILDREELRCQSQIFLDGQTRTRGRNESRRSTIYSLGCRGLSVNNLLFA